MFITDALPIVGGFVRSAFVSLHTRVPSKSRESLPVGWSTFESTVTARPTEKERYQ